MRLNKTGKLRKHHQFIGAFSIKKGTFDHKSTNQPPDENKKLHFIYFKSLEGYINIIILHIIISFVIKKRVIID